MAINPFSGSDTYSRRYQRKYAAMFKPGSIVLDIGCGAGVFLELLHELNSEGFGVDVNPEAVSICREKGLRAEESDIIGFLERNKQLFDGVFCSHMLEHQTTQLAERLLRSAYETLRPEGLLIIITPNFSDIRVMGEFFWLDATHVRPYPAALVRLMLENAGFNVLDCGLDRDTRLGIPKRNLLLTLDYILHKLRFGQHYGSGDIFVIAQKPGLG
jgi:O-antigen chain-terminating methyltransferase